jgi:hypothetical protein
LENSKKNLGTQNKISHVATKLKRNKAIATPNAGNHWCGSNSFEFGASFFKTLGVRMEKLLTYQL